MFIQTQFIVYFVLAAFFIGLMSAYLVVVFLRYRAFIYLGSNPHRVIVSHPDPKVTREAAASRRAFLEKALDRSKDQPGLEIVEQVPGFFELERRELSQREADAQRVSIRWQLHDDALLLMGRVMDALQAIARREELSFDRLAEKVCIVPGRTKTAQFRVIIETFAENFIEREMAGIASWLGISVAVRRPVEAIGFGQGLCQMPGGKAGWAGGTIRFGGNPFLLTCAHVVSSKCKSLFDRAELNALTNEPDAALLQFNTPCFAHNPNPILVQSMSETDVNGQIITKSDTRLLTEPNRYRIAARSRTAHVEDIAICATYSGRTHFFPHVTIASDVKLIMDIFYWPILANNFSKEGDSGSWVVAGDKKWLGMLVAGKPRHHLSYVALAEPLVEYLQGRYIKLAGANLTSINAFYEVADA